MPIISATWETEMGGFTWKTNIGTNSYLGSISKHKLGVVVHACNLRYLGDGGERILAQSRLYENKLK
jgi:hypothetical protein